MLTTFFQLSTTKKVIVACLTVILVLYIMCVPSIHVIRPLHEEFVGRQLNLSGLTEQESVFLSPLPHCPSSVQRLFIIVCSAAQNFAQRQAIRSTWGAKTSNVSVFFLIGRPLNNLSDHFIALEKEDFKDVIHYNFTDTYYNLTLKSFMLLKWTRLVCNKAEFIMKVDDDTFVNLQYLLDQLSFYKSERLLLLGRLIEKAVPVRDPSSKWFAPENVYQRSMYPNYLSGSGYVMSAETVPVIHKYSMKLPLFYLEDIFVTGICAEAAGIIPRNHESFTYVRPKLETCALRRLITAHRLKANEQLEAWHLLHTSGQKCRQWSIYRFFRKHFF